MKIKTLSEKKEIRYFFPKEKNDQNEFTVAEIIGYIYAKSIGSGNKLLFEQLFEVIDKSLIVDVLEIYLFHCFNENHALPLLDQKNKYATYALKNEKMENSNEMYNILNSSYRKIRNNQNLNKEDYSDYKILSDDEKKEKRKTLFYITSLSGYTERLDVLFSFKPFEEILREKYTIDIFKSYLLKDMNLELLNFAIKTLKLFESKDEMIIDNFINVRKGSLEMVGSTVRFNYFWKALNYLPSEKLAMILGEEMDTMKTNGSPDYIKNYDKVRKWCINNPEYGHHFSKHTNQVDENNFFAEPTESISFHLYVDSLQKLDKKHKRVLSNLDGYRLAIHNQFNSLKNIDILDNYIGTTTNAGTLGDKIVTITLNCRDIKYGVSNEVLKSFYESVIIDMVDSGYTLNKEHVKIKVEELKLDAIIPNAMSTKGKFLKM